MTMKKRMTLIELRKESPYQYGQIIQALNRNRYTPKKKLTNLEKHGIKNGFITLNIK